MVDLEINVKSFEEFLSEDTKSLSDAGHSNKPGDKVADKVEGHIDDGSEAKDPVEKSEDAAPGDAGGEKVSES